MRLRDETNRVARRVERAWKPKPLPLSSPGVPAKQTGASSCSTVSVSSSCYREPRPGHALPQAAGDIAMVYFMTSYIVSSPFEGYLPGLCAPGALVDALSSAVAAASLATLALRVRSARFMEVARRKYALALHQTNSSLAVPESAVLDKTLAAVLVLGLFEAVVFRGGQSPTSWTAHTFGAMELLQLRGPQQFKSDVARRLFAQASNNIRTSCIQRSVEVPAAFLAFSDEVGSSLDPKDLAVRLAPIIDRVASIKARSSTAPDPNLVHEALDLDRQIVSFAAGLEEEMLCTVRLQADKAPWAYRGTACQYPSLRVAKFWNAIHMLRMFLVSFISDGISGERDLASLRTPDTAVCKGDFGARLNEYAMNSMAGIATQVLASVPGFIEPRDPEGRFSPPARSLVWPLSILHKCSICPEEAREHSLVCLDKLARDLNMPQAVYSAADPGSKEDW
ncbi:Uncharacterized protein TCAP_01619 [Tolypocladium capitatum]|uniref:Uncharacterized protein n=1 Tax=Tolypocladium capitatum TaxID=45235 RepID=A0A2K3QLP8_9HYPO|nr:Uncharacterized protein TCAP_01619 [Tolypocladium capitatum]